MSRYTREIDTPPAASKASNGTRGAAVNLPCSPLYGFFALPRRRLLKVHAEPCTFAPGYLQSIRPRWPGEAA